ncbi:ABC transporter ATP-binding protein [Winogradskyella aurantiaca]|uniref:ABC transporter ATP-binding protein n=1 Tax=Winogradskyella aurantiaca TaxID=2219558 RepID=UPI0037447092
MGSILKIENLSKQYRLGLVGTGTLRDDLKRWWYNILGKEDPFLKIGESNDQTIRGESNYVWALKDINFEVEQGEVLGVIGKNGAGKSTLLKILSRVTSPTIGVVKSKGRIASLLEVGTGFHPEMTGRENIYLNGAILGMTKAEIRGKEQEIIAFSGCERYIDTPVKRYSSGMRVRLAFAVAAHLEPDVLVVDEVLAVGDAEFQKKAIGKMKDISKGEGRTVLFVSHNMAAVKSICSKALVLENGQKVFDGGTDEAVTYYLKGNNNQLNSSSFQTEFDTELYCLRSIEVKNDNKVVGEPIVEDKEIVISTDIEIKSSRPERYHITYHLRSETGEPLFSISHRRSGLLLKKGDNKIHCVFPKSFLQPGQFFLSIYLIEDRRQAIFIEKDIANFLVVNGARELGVFMGREPGFIRPQFEWYEG